MESKDTTGRMKMLLWKLWSARNYVLWNDVHQHAANVGRTTLDSLQQWNEVHVQANNQPRRSGSHKQTGPLLLGVVFVIQMADLWQLKRNGGRVICRYLKAKL
jgi:hypothetical protein